MPRRRRRIARERFERGERERRPTPPRRFQMLNRQPRDLISTNHRESPERTLKARACHRIAIREEKPDHGEKESASLAGPRGLILVSTSRNRHTRVRARERDKRARGYTSLDFRTFVPLVFPCYRCRWQIERERERERGRARNEKPRGLESFRNLVQQPARDLFPSLSFSLSLRRGALFTLVIFSFSSSSSFLNFVFFFFF